MLRPGLQRKRTVAALSQAGRARPDQPIRAIQPAGRTHAGRRLDVCDRRQTASSLNAPVDGGIMTVIVVMLLLNCRNGFSQCDVL